VTLVALGIGRHDVVPGEFGELRRAGHAQPRDLVADPPPRFLRRPREGVVV
jgi:hypothetical protein